VSPECVDASGPKRSFTFRKDAALHSGEAVIGCIRKYGRPPNTGNPDFRCSNVFSMHNIDTIFFCLVDIFYLIFSADLEWL
jgi:hypothetical protein